VPLLRVLGFAPQNQQEAMDEDDGGDGDAAGDLFFASPVPPRVAQLRGPAPRVAKLSPTHVARRLVSSCATSPRTYVRVAFELGAIESLTAALQGDRLPHNDVRCRPPLPAPG